MEFVFLTITVMTNLAFHVCIPCRQSMGSVTEPYWENVDQLNHIRWYIPVNFKWLQHDILPTLKAILPSQVHRRKQYLFRKVMRNLLKTIFNIRHISTEFISKLKGLENKGLLAVFFLYVLSAMKRYIFVH